MDIRDLYELPILDTGLIILGVLILAIEGGYRLGLRKRSDDPEIEVGDGGDIALTSMLALLGLMLAFTYSFTLSRADARKQAVVNEANAIGTAFLRADLAPEPIRGELRTILRDYAKTRIPENEGSLDREGFRKEVARSLEIQAKLWPATARMVKAGNTSPIAASIVQSINEVVDMHGKRMQAIMDRLPTIVFVMLVFVAAASLFVTGFSSGRRGRLSRWRLALLAAVLASVIMVITDFDRGSSGYVQVNKQGLVDLIRDMDAELSKK